MGSQTRKYFLSLALRQSDGNSDGKFGIYEYEELEQSVQATTGQRPTTGNGNLATKTGNTMTDRIVIPMANRRILMTARSIKACPSNFVNDRHFEMEMCLFCN